METQYLSPLPMIAPEDNEPATTLPATIQDLGALAATGDHYLVQELLKSHPDPNVAYPATGLRPIHLAASRGYLEVVVCLVEQGGAQVDATDKEGETALLKAAYAGHLPVVEYLVRVQHANIHHVDRDGWSVLHNACSAGHLGMVRFLVDRGVDVNGRSRMGHTPLINAASKGHLAVVDYLLNEAKVNPLCRNKFGELAYDAAAAAGEAYLCELLEAFERGWWMQHRSQPEEESESGREPYNLLALHVTVTVVLHENQRSTSSLMGLSRPYFTAEALNKSDRRGPWSLHPSGQPMTKRDVKLPPLDQHAWFWLTDWNVDYSHPGVDEEGWQYAKSLEEPKEENWSPEMPVSGSGWVRRRRWVRVMKRRADPAVTASSVIPNRTNEDIQDLSTLQEQVAHLRSAIATLQENEISNESREQISKLQSNLEFLQNEQEYLEQTESMRQASTRVTLTKAQSVFVDCRTHTQSIDEHDNEAPMASPRPTEEDDQSGRWSLQSVRPIYAWEKNEQALDCRRCNRWFNLLIRRHHCRRCGLIVCDRCSTNRVMLPYSQIVQDPSLPVDQHYLVSLQPQRVCDVCFGDLSKPATRLSNRPSFSGSSMHRSISMQSVMMECPVCGKLLSEYGTINEQEQHVQSCLNAGTSAAAVTGSRYLVYILAANSALVGQECVICFEEFEQGDTIARLSCLCSYHRHCIHDWFSKGKECPVHSR